MRIVITSPPRSGNHWLKCLLSTSTIWSGSDPGAGGHRPDEVQAWAARGGFRDNSIYFQHCRFSDRALRCIGGRARASGHGHPRSVRRLRLLLPLGPGARRPRARPGARHTSATSSPARRSTTPWCCAYIAQTVRQQYHPGQRLAAQRARGRGALRGSARDPVAELTRATDQLQPVTTERIDDGDRGMRAENMRQMKPKFAWQVRAATVGDSRQHLDEPALAVFREHHADTIRALGYEVR